MAIECYEGTCKWHQKDEPFCTQEECQECPNCRKLDFVPEPIEFNTISEVKCKFCGVLIRIYMRQYNYLTLAQEAKSWQPEDK